MLRIKFEEKYIPEKSLGINSASKHFAHSPPPPLLLLSEIRLREKGVKK